MIPIDLEHAIKTCGNDFPQMCIIFSMIAHGKKSGAGGRDKGATGARESWNFWLLFIALFVFIAVGLLVVDCCFVRARHLAHSN